MLVAGLAASSFDRNYPDAPASGTRLSLFILSNKILNMEYKTWPDQKQQQKMPFA